MRKLNVPIALLKEIEPILKENLALIEVHQDDETYYTITGSGPLSKFYFKIWNKLPVSLKNRTQNPHSVGITVKPYPSVRDRIQEHTYPSSIEAIPNSLKEWIKVLNEYHQTESTLDDPIIQYYQKEILEKIELQEEDANYHPFDITRMRMIESYLSELQNEIEQTKLLTDEKKSIVVKEIKNLKVNLTSKPKKIILQKLSWIWATIKKNSPEFFKEILLEATKRLLFDGIKFLS